MKLSGVLLLLLTSQLLSPSFFLAALSASIRAAISALPFRPTFLPSFFLTRQRTRLTLVGKVKMILEGGLVDLRAFSVQGCSLGCVNLPVGVDAFDQFCKIGTRHRERDVISSLSQPMCPT